MLFYNILPGVVAKAAALVFFKTFLKTYEGSCLSETVSDIRKAAKGATVTKGLAVHGSGVNSAETAISEWVRETGKL